MGVSRYVAELRERVGSRLLLLPGVAAILRNDAGEILLQLRSDDGNWNLPAGGIDPGETPFESVVREVREETGLQVVPRRVAGVFGGPRHRHVYPNGDLLEPLTVVFDCTVVGGEVHEQPGETEGLRYFAPDEAARLLPEYPAELFLPPSPAEALFETGGDSGADESPATDPPRTLDQG